MKETIIDTLVECAKLIIENCDTAVIEFDAFGTHYKIEKPCSQQ